ncbi:MAG: hypothetical protein ACOCWW_01265 [Bacteroidota bacterium]
MTQNVSIDSANDECILSNSGKLKAKNILILTRSYPPYDGGNVGHSIRMYYLCNYLAENGYNVFVFFFYNLIEDREHPPKNKKVFLLNPSFEKRRLDFNSNTDVLNFCLDIIKKNEISTIISSSPPIDAHLIAQSLKLYLNKKILWICDLRDITSFHPNLRAKTAKQLERQKNHEISAISYSDVITTVSIGAKNTIIDLHRSSKSSIELNDIFVVENGYIDLEEVPPQSDFENFILSSRKDDRIVLVYAGTGAITGDLSCSVAKNITLLFEVLSRVPIFRKGFSLVVQGNVKVNPQYLKSLHPELNFCLLPRTDNRQMRANLKLCDMGVIVSTDSILAPIGMAGKLYEYISCNLCLLQIIPGNSTSRMEFAKKHQWKPFIADAHDTHSIIETLHDILRNRTNLDIRRFTNEEIQPYHRYRQYNKIIELIKSRNKYKRSISDGLALDNVRQNSVINSLSQAPLKENLVNIHLNHNSLLKKF